MSSRRARESQRKSRSVLQLDISKLGLRPGSLLAVTETVPSPSRIGLDQEAIEEGAPLELDLRIESVSEGALVTGTVSAPTVGQCVRCLKPITGDVQIDLTELFAYPDSATDVTTDDDEMGRVVDDTVDLEQSIVDAVGLELPFAPLCEPDCPGLCQQCGVALATAEEGHHHDIIDPRWAKLAGMLSTDGDGGEPRGDQ